MKFPPQKVVLVYTLLISSFFADAQISLPKVFGDSMVLQRGIKIPVWGTSAPGAVVVAKLGNATTSVKADRQGHWKLHFPVFQAGGPYSLEIAEAGRPGSAIKLNGILIGDVWVASGQSNMEWPVKQVTDANAEISNAQYPAIRFLVVKQGKQFKPSQDIKEGKWKACDSNNVQDWSAVAYFFARKIHNDQHVPIGIIQSTWNGTPIEAWTSRDMLLTSAITREKTLSNDTITDEKKYHAEDSLNQVVYWQIVYNPQNRLDTIVTTANYNDSNWKPVEMPNLMKDFGAGYFEGMTWLRKKISLPENVAGKDLRLNLGRPEMVYSLYFNGQEICKNVWNGNPSHIYTIPAKWVQPGENIIALRMGMMWGGGGLNIPADSIYITDNNTKISLAGKWLYNKDIEPAFPTFHNYQHYPTTLFNAMIHPLIPYGIKGFIWYQGEANAGAAYDYRSLFPMMIKDWRQRWKQGDLPFLFVQLANYMKIKPSPSESDWALLREAQTMTLALPNTGMATAIDIGEAGDIHPKNKQEVGRRLALVANKMVYKQNDIASGPMYKSYRIAGNRIYIQFSNTGAALSAKDRKELTGFAIAGKDKIFYWAQASIVGKEVVVTSDKVTAPVAVRYAWADNPECNLINAAGLPAVPFRTDDWKRE